LVVAKSTDLRDHVTLIFLGSFDLFPWDNELTKVHIVVAGFSPGLFLPA
jgi:hypothetical protein